MRNSVIVESGGRPAHFEGGLLESMRYVLARQALVQ